MILAVEIGEYATHVERRRHGEAGRGELLVNTARIVRVERLDETVRRFSISQFARRISGADLGLQGRAGLDQIIDMLDGTQARFGRFEDRQRRSEEHTSELQSLMRISYAVFCLKKKNTQQLHQTQNYT